MKATLVFLSVAVFCIIGTHADFPVDTVKNVLGGEQGGLVACVLNAAGTTVTKIASGDLLNGLLGGLTGLISQVLSLNLSGAIASALQTVNTVVQVVGGVVQAVATAIFCVLNSNGIIKGVLSGDGSPLNAITNIGSSVLGADGSPGLLGGLLDTVLGPKGIVTSLLGTVLGLLGGI